MLREPTARHVSHVDVRQVAQEGTMIFIYFFDFLVKVPLRRRHYAAPVSRTAGGAIKAPPQGNRRYILFNPISPFIFQIFSTFFRVLLPYIEFITR